MPDSGDLYFARLPELPLAPPPGLRSYVPLADDPDPVDAEFSIEAARGLSLCIEYCDSHGWVSVRTIRCEAADGLHPGYLRAWCGVRNMRRVFRTDRIISITHLRTGRLLDGCGHQLVLDAIFGRTPRDGVDAEPIGGIERDGAAMLLAMAGADAGPAERSVVADYVAAERAARGAAVPAARAVAIWVDHFVPDAAFVAEAEQRMWSDRDALVRLLPWTLKVAGASGTVGPEKEDLLRCVMDCARKRYAAPHRHAAPPVFALR